MKNVIYHCTGFEWDEGNSDKNWYLHEVTNRECEEMFFNLPLLMAIDAQHAYHEPRYYALGRTDTKRWLFVAFTVRGDLIRVISARDMNEKEAKKYDEQLKRYSKL